MHRYIPKITFNLKVSNLSGIKKRPLINWIRQWFSLLSLGTLEKRIFLIILSHCQVQELWEATKIETAFLKPLCCLRLTVLRGTENPQGFKWFVCIFYLWPDFITAGKHYLGIIAITPLYKGHCLWNSLPENIRWPYFYL